MEKLSDEEIEKSLNELNGWSVVNGKLHKEIEFVGFTEAWKFMTIAVTEIEKMNHHPEWFNVYGLVQITLSTHDCDGLSERDIALALFIDVLKTPS